MSGLSREEFRQWATSPLTEVVFAVLKERRQGLLELIAFKDMPEVQVYKIRGMIESMDALSAVLPFQADEKAFLDCLQTHGEIKPELISDDEAFCWRVKRHPSLLWRSKIK